MKEISKIIQEACNLVDKYLSDLNEGASSSAAFKLKELVSNLWKEFHIAELANDIPKKNAIKSKLQAIARENSIAFQNVKKKNDAIRKSF